MTGHAWKALLWIPLIQLKSGVVRKRGGAQPGKPGPSRSAPARRPHRPGQAGVQLAPPPANRPADRSRGRRWFGLRGEFRGTETCPVHPVCRARKHPAPGQRRSLHPVAFAGRAIPTVLGRAGCSATHSNAIPTLSLNPFDLSLDGLNGIAARRAGATWARAVINWCRTERSDMRGSHRRPNSKCARHCPESKRLRDVEIARRVVDRASRSRTQPLAARHVREHRRDPVRSTRRHIWHFLCIEMAGEAKGFASVLPCGRTAGAGGS